MACMITLKKLLGACADDSFDDGIRIDTDLVPLAGPGGPVKPAVYEGGTYQQDRRWAAPDDAEPTLVIVIDDVPSQANRLEEALRRNLASARVPELVLDLSDLSDLPAHLPRRLSLLERPNAHLYETGRLRRVHLRHHPNILKRVLVQVCGFNLGLLMRQLTGVGTPRSLQGPRGGRVQRSDGLAQPSLDPRLVLLGARRARSAGFVTC